MTQTPYGPPVRCAPVALSGPLVVLKVLIAVTLVLAALAAAALAGVAATIVYSGCFLSCEQGNPAGGLLLGLLAVAVLVAGPWLAWVMWRRAGTPRGVTVWAAIVLGLPGMYVLSLLSLGLFAGVM